MVLGIVCCYVRLLEGMEMRVFTIERLDAAGTKNGEETAMLGRRVWLRGGGDGEGFERILKRLESRLDLKAELEKSLYGQIGVRGAAWISQSRDVALRVKAQEELLGTWECRTMYCQVHVP